jgi:HD superfamily phosphodiesterase
MAKFTDIEKELLSSVTDDRLRSNLEKIREAMEDIWGTGIHIIQDYTDHGIDHSKRVADFAYKLLKANDGRDI